MTDATGTHVAPGFDKFCSCRSCQENRRAAADASSNRVPEGHKERINAILANWPMGIAPVTPAAVEHILLTAHAIPNRVCEVCSETGHWIDDTCPECKGVDATRNRVYTWEWHEMDGTVTAVRETDTLKPPDGAGWFLRRA